MISDEAYILSYKETRQKKVLSPLFTRYNEKLFGLAYYYLSDREAALDTVMESYEAFLLSVDQKEITYFKGWILSICRNLSLKKLRDTKKFTELTESSENFVESDTDLVYSDEDIEKILELIPQLKHSQRICIEAFYLKNKSYEDIILMTGYSYNEVKSNIQNGKRKLKLMFEENTQ